MADVAGYPDDPLRTFPTGDPYVRRAEFGGAGLVTYLKNDGTSKVVIIDITWVGWQMVTVLTSRFGPDRAINAEVRPRLPRYGHRPNSDRHEQWTPG